jgi:site-specific DNA-cytosine methylase
MTFVPAETAGTLGASHGNVRADEAWTNRLVPTSYANTGSETWSESPPRLGAHQGRQYDALVFDRAQVTSPEHRVDYQPGRPASPLAATGQMCIAHTLRGDGFASEDGTGRGTPLVPVAFNWQDSGRHLRSSSSSSSNPLRANHTEAVSLQQGVRRLTPREAERLQGVPDDFTLVPYRGKPAADGPRYRALGNGVAVPVVEWIAGRVAAAVARPEQQQAGANL